MELAEAPVQGAGVGRADRASLSGQVQQAGAAFRGHPLGEIADGPLGSGGGGLGPGSQRGQGSQFPNIGLGWAALALLQGGLPEPFCLLGAPDALQALDDGQEVRGVRSLCRAGPRHVPGRKSARLGAELLEVLGHRVDHVPLAGNRRVQDSGCQHAVGGQGGDVRESLLLVVPVQEHPGFRVPEGVQDSLLAVGCLASPVFGLFCELGGLGP